MRHLPVLCVTGILILGGVMPAGASVPDSPYFDYSLDEGIFTVYAALNLAGYDQVTNYFGMHPLRARVRESLRGKEGLEKSMHNIAHAAHTLGHLGGIFALSRFVEVSDGPPDFALGDLSEYSVETRQLVEAGEKTGLTGSLAEFYRKADIASLWKEAMPEYEAFVAEMDRTAGSVAEAALSVIGVPPPGRAPVRVTVVPNLMIPYWSVSRYMFEGRPFVMVGPDVRPDPSVPVRAVLEVALEDALTDHLLEVREKRELFDLVRDHERIELCCDTFRDLALECLVWAVWLHVSGEDPRWIEGEQDRLYAQGYILIKVFYQAVAAGPAASPSEVVKRALESVDPRRETARWKEGEVERARWLSLLEADLDRRQGRLSDAHMKYEQILEADPDNPRARYGYGSLLFTQERYEEARAMLEQAIVLKPDEDWVTAWSWIRLGWIEDLEGNREEALQAYQRAADTGSTYMNATAVARRYLETPYEEP